LSSASPLISETPLMTGGAESRDQPSRSEAICWLIRKGLKAEALKSNK
jgi:hypothetical protein